MGFSNEKAKENEIEQYGTAVGIAISNGLHDEAIDMAFIRGGGITVRENVQGTSLPARADLDANAAGGPDATLTFAHGEGNELNGLTISSYGSEGSVNVAKNGDRVASVTVDKDGDGKVDTSLQYERENNGALKAIRVDENNDGKVDAIITADYKFGAPKDAPAVGFNVDVDADGTIDGFAEFIRNEQAEIKSIRLRQRQ